MIVSGVDGSREGGFVEGWGFSCWKWKGREVGMVME